MATSSSKDPRHQPQCGDINIKDGDIGFKGGNTAQHDGETSENMMDYEMGGEKSGEVKGT